ncbi:hypothetical protein D9M70_494110 [compost metagenome]
MQQPVRVESVVDESALAEGKAHAGAALADHGLGLGDLRGRAAILLAEVVGDGLAFGGHVGVQLEGMQHDLGIDAVAQPLQRQLERRQADGAPRAGDVGDEVDSEGLGHGDFLAGSSGMLADRVA